MPGPMSYCLLREIISWPAFDQILDPTTTQALINLDLERQTPAGLEGLSTKRERIQDPKINFQEFH